MKIIGIIFTFLATLGIASTMKNERSRAKSHSKIRMNKEDEEIKNPKLLLSEILLKSAKLNAEMSYMRLIKNDAKKSMAHQKTIDYLREGLKLNRLKLYAGGRKKLRK